MQQQEQRHHDDEYIAAQRAAVEAVLIGRATAAAVERQGEQLSRADDLADETQFILNRANRTLKGMTSWSGWVSNLLTPVPTSSSLSFDHYATKKQQQQSHSATTTTNNNLRFEHYDQFPASFQPAAQAIINYHANVTVLELCETEEQKITCIQICDNMYRAASRQLENNDDFERLEAYRVQIATDLAVLRKRQSASQRQVRGLDIAAAVVVPAGGGVATTSSSPTSSGVIRHHNFGTDAAAKTKLFGRPPESGTGSSAPGGGRSHHASVTTTAPPATSTASSLEQEQDRHLNFLAASLGELGHIAQNLNEGLTEQHDRLDQLDTKSANVLETSKLVGRRTDRLIQKKSWTTAPPTYVGRVTIRHVESGKYMTAMPNTELWLIDRVHRKNATFRLYKRQSSGSGMFGLQNEGSRLWIGQHWITGALGCAATSFGRREEFQADDTNHDFLGPSSSKNNNKNGTVQQNNQPTRLLCASAGWGQGGYLHVNEKYELFIGGLVGSTGNNNNKTAPARWLIVPCDDDDNAKNAGATMTTTTTK